MPAAPGTRLGPYEIVRPIGAGGMGEVYEARSIAALNPNICALHDIGGAGGHGVLVMERLEGGVRPRNAGGFGTGGHTLVKMFRNLPPETYDLVYAANDPDAMRMALQIREVLSSGGLTNASTAEAAAPPVQLGIFAPGVTPGIKASPGRRAQTCSVATSSSTTSGIRPTI